MYTIEVSVNNIQKISLKSLSVFSLSLILSWYQSLEDLHSWLPKTLILLLLQIQTQPLHNL